MTNKEIDKIKNSLDKFSNNIENLEQQISAKLELLKTENKEQGSFAQRISKDKEGQKLMR